MVRVGPHKEINVLIRRGRETRAISLFLPYEDTVRKQLSASQEEGSHQEPIVWHLDLGLSSLWNCEK